MSPLRLTAWERVSDVKKIPRKLGRLVIIDLLY